MLFSVENCIALIVVGNGNVHAVEGFSPTVAILNLHEILNKAGNLITLLKHQENINIIT